MSTFAVVPVSNTLFTPVPLIIAIIIKIIYEKITGKSAKDTTDVKEITQSESSMVPVANGKKPADSALDAHFVSGSVEGGVVNLAADLRDDVL
ncbi:hypothetical protein SK128_006849 [Halocaridina rubra]|uniref:Uncharacterized protein n=1 Tax=Halocaridina rubra TaxID=373956 RepID=A0AAN9A0K1_HALRR